MLYSVVFLNIKDYLFEKCIKNDVEISSKEDAIEMLVELQNSAGNLKNKEEFKNEVIKRENELSTSLGCVAIPHAKSETVKRPALSKIKLKKPFKWDGNSVNEIYLLASPDSNSHIEMLSVLAEYLQNGENTL